jgi:predicted transposase YdaD
LPKKKQDALKESKPFDSLLKALFDEQSEEIISCLLPGSQRPTGIPTDQLNVELNRNTLSIDIGRHIVYKEEHATFNLEAQSGPDDDLLPRMHEYALNLYRTYKRPVISVALLLFECAVPEIPFIIQYGGQVSSIFYPMIICMWRKDAGEVVRSQQRCLYPLLPTMKNATVELLTQGVREMHTMEDRPYFARHLAWFHTMLGRTTTVSQEDKLKMEEVLKMQYPGFALFREDPVIGGMILEGELKGKAEGKAEGRIEGQIKGRIEGIQDSILDIVRGSFSPQAVEQVQQVIAVSQDEEQLRKFLRRVARLSDEQEVLDLLAECFLLVGETKNLQGAILDIVGDSFSSQVVAQVRRAIATSQDAQQLRRFLRKVVRLSDEQEVSALLAECFPVS